MDSRRVPTSIVDYLSTVSEEAQQILGSELAAMYAVGSLAHDDFRDGVSDIDLLAICFGPVPVERKRALAEKLRNESIAIPAVGLEMICVTADTVGNPTSKPPYELWMSSGENWPFEAAYDGIGQGLLIEFAISREKGIRILGDADVAFGEISRSDMLGALANGLEWHRQRILDAFHDPMGQYSVLNACRAWAFAEDGVLLSKDQGAEWALKHSPDNHLILGATRIRAGQSKYPLEIAEIDKFLLEGLERLNEKPML